LRALPRLLDGLLDRLEEGDAPEVLARASEDAAVTCAVALRFFSDKQLGENPSVQLAGFELRRLHLRALLIVMAARVRPAFLEGYRAGEAVPEVSGDPTDVAFFYALAEDDPERTDAVVVGAAERAYHRWVEDVCLDEDNGAFETSGSPFASREDEVLKAVVVGGPTAGVRAERPRDLSPFVSRPRNRDALRLLGKLETWFLRQYDVHHAAVVRYHAEALRTGPDDPDRVLSRHSPSNYVLGLLVAAAPFLAAVFAYDRAPRFFDTWASLQVILISGAAAWFLFWRFMWKKDLTIFHTSVPRIGAGIIVGYLPVFLIDEVWDLAEQSPVYLFAVIGLLGSTTLLYLYLEVERRLRNPPEAFRRARGIFLLGLAEAGGFGMLVTSVLGPLMAGRNWGTGAGMASIETLRTVQEPFLGALPRVVGIEPLLAFPTAVLLMSFLAFFIGTFLQLLWEELPITEPL